jgi:hypothetical protein
MGTTVTRTRFSTNPNGPCLRGGHDTSQAEVLLLEFEHSQTLYVASYDQIREQLNGSGLRK